MPWSVFKKTYIGGGEGNAKTRQLERCYDYIFSCLFLLCMSDACCLLDLIDYSERRTKYSSLVGFSLLV